MEGEDLLRILDLEDILITSILDWKPMFRPVEIEDVVDGPFVEPNSAVALESALPGHPTHAGVTMDVDVSPIGMADVIDKVWVVEDVGS